jgi:hypothetical protein
MPERPCSDESRSPCAARQSGVVGVSAAVMMARKADRTMTSRTYKGKCFCGAVEVTVTGGPVAMGYCHCGRAAPGPRRR